MSNMGRLRDTFAACVGAVARWVYAGSYPYTVVSCNWDAQTLELRSVVTPDDPPLSGVPMRTPGLRLDIAPGTRVLVRFEGMDPTQPYVADYGTAPGSVLRVDILGGITPVALQGMAVQVNIAPSTVLVASPSPPGYMPNPSPIPCDGTITGGSSTIRGLS